MNNRRLTATEITDSSWVRQSFLLAGSNITREGTDGREWLTFTTASTKFVDTQLGGNFAINNPPQYTHTADIVAPNLSPEVNQQPLSGLGRFWSEQIDDNSQVIHMQMGVPAFNGMLSFFTGFYNASASVLAREGRYGGIFLKVGQIVGTVLTFHPVLLAAMVLGTVGRFFLNRPSSKYYYFSPAMGPYWDRFNFIANTIGVNMGIITPENYFGDAINESEKSIDSPENYPSPNDLAAQKKYLNNMAPNIFKPDGRVDVYYIASRAQRLADARYKLLTAAFKGADTEEALFAALEKTRNTPLQLKDTNPNVSIGAYLDRYQKSVFGDIALANTSALSESELQSYVSTAKVSDVPSDPTAQEANAAAASGATPAPVTDVAQLRPRYVADAKTSNGARGILKVLDGWGDKLNKAGAMLHADIAEGSAFVGFRVDHTGESNESFNNSTSTPAIASKFNGASTAAREARFSFSNGVTGIPGVDGVISAVKDLATGVVDGVHMSGLLALAGSAFVDIPDQWESSTTSFPSMSYTMQLRSPYGNALSRFQNLHLPLAALLAAALPISTGRQSYTSPPLIQLWSPGRAVSRLAIIDSVSITRGTGNMGWNNKGDMLGMDVHFTVKDLSSIMHAPISPGFELGSPFAGIFDDDNPFSDYMAVLANVSMADQIYPLRKLKLRMSLKKASMSSYFSTTHASNWFGNSQIGQFLSMGTRASERLI